MKKYRLSPITFFLVVLIISLLAGCDQGDKNSLDNTKKTAAVDVKPGCKSCHDVQLDIAHDLDCTTCHHGDNTAATAEAAHQGLIELPAHPYNMNDGCGRCHPDQTQKAAQSIHFTLSRLVNSVRKAFGATDTLHSLTDIPVNEPPTTATALADDLLRRRCLRCHLYYQGDPYPETEHGIGCAACHLAFKDNAMQSHRFVRYPGDEQCLHCHNGNRVGSDYYGRFERDFSREFRTPYRTDDTFPRPYGVEYHQLLPDIHQLAGIACIDCHPGAQLMNTAHQKTQKTLTCQDCHNWQPGRPAPSNNMIVKGNQLVLVTKIDKKQVPVVLIKNPIHRKYKDKATCVACHAQWSYNDQGTHLMRQDIDDYYPWAFLTVQGSMEVEAQVENNLYADVDSEPMMIDKLTGAVRPGLWYKGFEQRRWEPMLYCNDKDGRITVCRPSMDLHLSYINDDEEVIFDSVAVTPSTKKITPYTPHTIGKAGVFYKQRLSEHQPYVKK